MYEQRDKVNNKITRARQQIREKRVSVLNLYYDFVAFSLLSSLACSLCRFCSTFIITCCEVMISNANVSYSACMHGHFLRFNYIKFESNRYGALRLLTFRADKNASLSL